jgi:hypothetical protein
MPQERKRMGELYAGGVKLVLQAQNPYPASTGAETL